VVPAAVPISGASVVNLVETMRNTILIFIGVVPMF
jgi:hypothetical protein